MRRWRAARRGATGALSAYALTCLHCDATITTFEHVGDDEIAAVEQHLRDKHPAVLADRQHVDFAELLGQVRVKMPD